MFVLEEHVARRRAIHALYTSLLKDISGISVVQNPSSDRGMRIISRVGPCGNGTSEHLGDIGYCLSAGLTLTDEDIMRVVKIINFLIK